MLYTGKGDQGTSKLFNTASGVRISKSSLAFEVLGTLDELDSFVGFARAYALEMKYMLGDISLEKVALGLQEDIFIIQAEIAGAEMKMVKEKVEKLEELTNTIEGVLPPIKTFFIPGATEGGARFDIARTVVRRTERLLVTYQEKENKVNPETLRYMNRLSSVLYALARYVNHLEGVVEKPPSYT